MVDRQAELRSSDEAATLPPNRGIHRIRTHEVRPKGENRPKPIRINGALASPARLRRLSPLRGSVEPRSNELRANRLR